MKPWQKQEGFDVAMDKPMFNGSVQYAPLYGPSPSWFSLPA